MPQLTMKQRIFFLLLTGSLILLLNQHARLPGPAQPSQPATQLPSPQQSTAVPTTQFTPHCLDEKDVSRLLGKNFELQNEQLSTDKVSQTFLTLECFYRSPETIKDLPVSAKYYVSNVPQEELWQSRMTEYQNAIGSRSIENRSHFFAVINPVKELRQITLYTWKSPYALEVTYIPVQESDNDLVNKGVQFTDEINASLSAGQN